MADNIEKKVKLSFELDASELKKLEKLTENTVLSPKGIKKLATEKRRAGKESTAVSSGILKASKSMETSLRKREQLTRKLIDTEQKLQRELVKNGGGAAKGSGGGGGGGGGLKAQLLKILTAVAAVGLGGTVALGRQAYSYRAQVERAQSGFAGGGQIHTTAQADRLSRARMSKSNFGVSPMEATKILTGLQTQIGGENMTKELAKTVLSASGTGTTLSSGDITGFLGSARQAGSTKGLNRQLKDTMAAATASGMEMARMPEFMKANNQLLQAGMQRSAGIVSASDIASLQAMFGKAGGAGFQGARGANILGGIDQGMRSQGSGAARAIKLRGVGFGKPGSDVTYDEAMLQLSRGLTGGPDIEQNFKNFQGIFKEMEGMFGKDSPAMRLALADPEMGFGLSQDQAQKLMDMMGGDLSGPDAFKDFKKIVGKENIDKKIIDNGKAQINTAAEHAAKLDARLDKHGAKITEDVRAVEDAINKGFDKTFDVAIKSLDMLYRIAGVKNPGRENKRAENDRKALEVAKKEGNTAEVVKIQARQAARAKRLAARGRRKATRGERSSAGRRDKLLKREDELAMAYMTFQDEGDMSVFPPDIVAQILREEEAEQGSKAVAAMNKSKRAKEEREAVRAGLRRDGIPIPNKPDPIANTGLSRAIEGVNDSVDKLASVVGQVSTKPKRPAKANPTAGPDE